MKVWACITLALGLLATQAVSASPGIYVMQTCEAGQTCSENGVCEDLALTLYVLAEENWSVLTGLQARALVAGPFLAEADRPNEFIWQPRMAVSFHSVTGEYTSLRDFVAPSERSQTDLSEPATAMPPPLGLYSFLAPLEESRTDRPDVILVYDQAVDTAEPDAIRATAFTCEVMAL